MVTARLAWPSSFWILTTDAPFSKFYLELDSEAPAMLGQYIGWKIVREYMDEYEVGVEEMLRTDAKTIFNKAK